MTDYIVTNKNPNYGFELIQFQSDNGNSQGAIWSNNEAMNYKQRDFEKENVNPNFQPFHVYNSNSQLQKKDSLTQYSKLYKLEYNSSNYQVGPLRIFQKQKNPDGIDCYLGENFQKNTFFKEDFAVATRLIISCQAMNSKKLLFQNLSNQIVQVKKFTSVRQAKNTWD
ncbi:UNKNOWN [Stylonychia lemnae]|uniref:Uncharacterized protein n=1 Tax=Stylonychia lemnae TaxID=5949 RepID=A0A078B643_STYLE|nr:UNKNOWN [Stylonychia lemnae]|eukprot:CDW89985.1 UNKNOWN [Stylonychia lemnae]